MRSHVCRHHTIINMGQAVPTPTSSSLPYRQYLASIIIITSAALLNSGTLSILDPTSETYRSVRHISPATSSNQPRAIPQPTSPPLPVSSTTHYVNTISTSQSALPMSIPCPIPEPTCGSAPAVYAANRATTAQSPGATLLRRDEHTTTDRPPIG